MSFEQACRILDIPSEVDLLQARRAYLRGVKRHKPEQDPEGFQRLRLAWETVRECLESAPVQPIQGKGLPLTSPEPVDGAAPVITESQGSASSPETTIPILRRWLRQTHGEIERGEVQGVVEGARRVADMASEHRIYWMVDELLRLYLSLQAVGQSAVAGEIHGILRTTIEDLGAIDRLRREPTLGYWLIADELHALPAEFPVEMRSVLARIVLTDEVSDEVCDEAQSALGDGQSRRATYLMLQDAPLLQEVFHQLPLPDLSLPPTAARRAPSWESIHLGLAILLILLGLAEGCGAW